MKRGLFLLLFLLPSVMFGGEEEFYSEQKQMIQQQQEFVIEDTLYEIEYLKKRVETNTATNYEKFKLHKLEKRLEKIQENNGIN